MTIPFEIKMRFMDNFTKTETCWIWNAAKHNFGHGRIQVNGKNCYAHRISYEIFKGPIPNNMAVCHSCDNPSCVNPMHLWVGSPAENFRDMFLKKRNMRGSQAPWSKLTEQKVKELRELYRSGEYTMKELGEKYGVYDTTICAIIHRKKWKHVL